MPACALMLERGDTVMLLRDTNTALKPGDRNLFVGNPMTRRLQRRYLSEPGTVSRVLSGTEPRSLFFRRLQQRERGQ